MFNNKTARIDKERLRRSSNWIRSQRRPRAESYAPEGIVFIFNANRELFQIKSCHIHPQFFAKTQIEIQPSDVRDQRPISDSLENATSHKNTLERETDRTLESTECIEQQRVAFNYGIYSSNNIKITKVSAAGDVEKLGVSKKVRQSQPLAEE